MSTHMPVFQVFFRGFCIIFYQPKITTSSIGLTIEGSQRCLALSYIPLFQGYDKVRLNTTPGSRYPVLLARTAELWTIPWAMTAAMGSRAEHVYGSGIMVLKGYKRNHYYAHKSWPIDINRYSWGEYNVECNGFVYQSHICILAWFPFETMLKETDHSGSQVLE